MRLTTMINDRFMSAMLRVAVNAGVSLRPGTPVGLLVGMEADNGPA